MNNGNFLNQMLHQLFEVDMQCKRELEEYIYYMIRCLGNNYNPRDVIVVHYDEPKGIRQAVVYPRTSIINGQGVVNPLFFKGYSIIMTKEGLEITFTENPQDFQ